MKSSSFTRIPHDQLETFSTPRLLRILKMARKWYVVSHCDEHWEDFTTEQRCQMDSFYNDLLNILPKREHVPRKGRLISQWQRERMIPQKS